MNSGESIGTTAPLPRAGRQFAPEALSPYGSLALLLKEVAVQLIRGLPIAVLMVRRSLAGSRRRSLLGSLLSFLPPLIVAAWCTLINHAHVINVESLQAPYPAFVLLSMMLWTTFVESLYAPITGLQEELPLLSQAELPVEAVILARGVEVIYQFGFKLVIIALAVLWFRLPITWLALASPVALLALVALGASIGVWLAPLNLLYQDVGKALGAITTFWLFVTPVLIPVPRTGWAATIVKLNPVTPVLSACRDLVMLGHVEQPWAFGLIGVCAAILLWTGCAWVRLSLPLVMEHHNL